MRSLRIAVVAQWALAGMFLLPGVTAMLNLVQRARGDSMGWAMANVTLLYFLPGILHVTCAVHLARRRLWAFTLAETLFLIYLLIISFIAIMSAMVTVVSYIMSNVEAGPIVFLIGSVLLFVILRWLCAVLDDAVRVTGPNVERGFQPVMLKGTQEGREPQMNIDKRR